MADKDLKDIISDALKGNSSEQIKQDAERLSINDELAKVLAEQENKSKEILKNIQLLEKNAKDTIDSEQILNELKEERIRKITEEFRLNQLVLLEVRKQLEQAENAVVKDEEAIKRLKHKISLLSDQITEQAKILEGDKKEKEVKEKIFSLVKQTYEMSKQYGQELEKHIIQISTLNGGYEKYKETIGSANDLLYASTVGTGIMFSEANQSIQELSRNFIGLSTQSAESIANMSKGVAQLGKLGVDAATASRGFDALVNAMGKTPAQAVKIQDSFVQMAAKNRLALGSVTQAFGENSSRFVGYGEQMTKVLDGLAEQSLKTGIAISKLVGIAQQFDTFEGAAKAVGNLNALLGGDYLNSIELLTASDDERIRLLKEAVSASGMQFESMNRFQKMAIANAAGISDLNEASKLFGQTSLQNTRQQAESAEVQKTLAEQAQSATLAMDKLKSSFNGLLLILEPIVTTLMEVVNFIADLVQGFKGLLEQMGLSPTIAAVVTSSLLAMLAVVPLLIGGFAVLVTTIGSFVAGLVSSILPIKAFGPVVADTIQTIGAAATKGAFGLLAIGGAIALIGIGIGAAALGFSQLVLAFKELGSEQTAAALNSIMTIMVGFTIMVVSLAAVALFAKTPIAGLAVVFLALGGAVALMGIGIGAAAAGIGLMRQSMTSLIDSFSKLNADEVGKFTSLFSDENIKQVEKFAEAISKLNDPFNTLNNNLKSIVTNLTTMVPDMSLQVSASPVSLATAATGLETVTNTTNSVINNTRNTSAQTLIPAQQTTAFVPLVVQIDKKTIIEILKEDVKNIAKGEALDTLDAVGVTQSAFYAINRVSNP
jgi:hypothetical protein